MPALCESEGIMKFEFDGKGYVIEFRRDFKEYLEYDAETGLDVSKKSTFPYTTASIVESDPKQPFDRRVYRTATVGYYHGDTFSLATGRVRALRLLTITLPKAMKPVVWKAYHDRVAKEPKPSPVTALVVSVKD